jgi:hypothetical protein
VLDVQRPELWHAGLVTSSATVELETPSRVACSDLLGIHISSILIGNHIYNLNVDTTK